MKIFYLLIIGALLSVPAAAQSRDIVVKVGKIDHMPPGVLVTFKVTNNTPEDRSNDRIEVTCAAFFNEDHVGTETDYIAAEAGETVYGEVAGVGYDATRVVRKAK